MKSFNNLKNIDNFYSPMYTWTWNSRIDKEGIKKRIDEMKAMGIEAFYVLSDPANFRPHLRNTDLTPEYLSDEYMELLKYAHEYAKENGMHTWMYNEGGFPSGAACGKVLSADSELYKRSIGIVKRTLEAGQPYKPTSKFLCAFDNDVRIYEGYTPESDTEITEYTDSNTRYVNEWASLTGVDIANKKTCELFLNITHEKMKKYLGNEMGTEITYMFDDEPSMGSWTKDAHKIFEDMYGYNILDYMPYITGQSKPLTDDQKKACIDYHMMCGELIANNYFLPMKKWLNDNGMKSVGHLNLDNMTDGFVAMRYGNPMKILRCYDVPGIDAIWRQISFPNDGKCCSEGFEFFPRVASSAARQKGEISTISESFAVYGAQITPEEMRFSVNFQAVRGINLFNFMVMSYEKEGPLPFQYRPNFIPEYPGMNMLSEINTYTKKLSYMMHLGKTHINTALYYPVRTIASGGDEAAKAIKDFENMGHMLESKGVCFDIIDEDFVLNCTKSDNLLSNGHVEYTNIFAPDCKYELDNVKDALKNLKSEIEPVVQCNSSSIKARRIDCEYGHAYFVYNESDSSDSFEITFAETSNPYNISLTSDKVTKLAYTDSDTGMCIRLTLARGEGRMIIFTDNTVDAEEEKALELVGTINNFDGWIKRKFIIDDAGINNIYYNTESKKVPLGKWDNDFSGEVAYRACVQNDIPEGKITVDLGNPEHSVTVEIDGNTEAVLTMPPYRFETDKLRKGSTILVTVANTGANQCASAEYFNKYIKHWIGPYHDRISKFEKSSLTGGFSGNVKLYK